MRLVFAGTPVTALPSLDAISASVHELVGVVTRPASPQGRSARLVPSPVAQWAQEHGVEVLTPEHPKDRDFRDRLTQLAPDCCPVVAYGALLPQRTLDIPVHGWVNLHFSLLPAYRGAAPVQRALMDGVQVTGATTFRIVRELDAGPVYGSITEPVAPLDTAGELLDRLAISGAACSWRRSTGSRRAPSRRRSRRRASRTRRSSSSRTYGSTGPVQRRSWRIWCAERTPSPGRGRQSVGSGSECCWRTRVTRRCLPVRSTPDAARCWWVRGVRLCGC
jgi:methionyl-tRNA formyltransferase